MERRWLAALTQRAWEHGLSWGWFRMTAYGEIDAPQYRVPPSRGWVEAQREPAHIVEPWRLIR